MKTQTNENPVYKLVTCALLIALEVVLGRWFAVRTPVVNISFAFVPLALCGMLLGPVYGFAAGGLSDFIGAMLFPQGPYFPGFTLTNALCGLVHGLLLYHRSGEEMNRKIFLLRAAVSVFLVNFGLQLLLNTYWLTVIGVSGKGYLALVGTRVIKYVVMAPVQFAVIAVLKDALLKPLLRMRARARIA